MKTNKQPQYIKISRYNPMQQQEQQKPNPPILTTQPQEQPQSEQKPSQPQPQPELHPPPSQTNTDNNNKQGQELLNVEYKQQAVPGDKEQGRKSRWESVSDRALELVHRMVRDRKQREKQVQARNHPTNTTTNNTHKNNNNYTTLQTQHRKIGNIAKNYDPSQPIYPTAIRPNRLYASIDAQNPHGSLYDSNSANMRRSLNIGKIVKVANSSIDQDYSLGKNKYVSAAFPQSISDMHRPPNLPPIPTRHSVDFNNRSFITYEKQRQLYILDKSKRMTEAYQLKKYITNIIFQICDEAVERIQQKRTFFSYRIHRNMYANTKTKQKQDNRTHNPISININKFSETIHPKHERTLQNANNLHQSYMMMSRVRKVKDKDHGNSQGQLEKSRNLRAGKSRIQPVFSYTFNVLNEEGTQHNEDDQDGSENKQISEKDQNEDEDNSQNEDSSSNQSNSQNESEGQKSSKKDQQAQKQQSQDESSESSSQNSHSTNKSNNQNKIEEQSDKKQASTDQQNEQTSNQVSINTKQVEQKKESQTKITKKDQGPLPITHRKLALPSPRLSTNRRGMPVKKK